MSDAPPAGDARLVPVRRPIPGPEDEDWARLDWGPHEPWVRPLLLAAADDSGAARAALRALPDGPYDLLREVRLCLTARAALAIGDRPTMERVAAALRPAAAELAAGSGWSPSARWPGTSRIWPLLLAATRKPPGTAVPPARSPHVSGPTTQPERGRSSTAGAGPPGRCAVERYTSVAYLYL
ncbi:hypothetical protein NKG94_20440 [Micromonospora sp. M12]